MFFQQNKLVAVLIISLISPSLLNAEQITNPDSQSAIYNKPIIKEATIEWPEPDPDEKLYLDYDPAYSQSLQQDRPVHTVIDTRKRGRNHFITVTLVGYTGMSLDTQLMIDTGASIVVLPESMMSDLGVSPYQTSSHRVQTVNGITDALFARIASLEIGHEIIQDISVAFIKDNSLGGIKLLGMNALKNYKVTLDDSNRTLTLDKNE